MPKTLIELLVPPTEAFEKLHNAMGDLGKVKKSDREERRLQGKARYGLNPVNLWISVEPGNESANTSTVEIEAHGQDVFGVAARKTIESLLDRVGEFNDASHLASDHKAEKKAARQQARLEAKQAAAAKAASEQASYGQLVCQGTIGLKNVLIYERGYVRVAPMFLGSQAPFERLHAIDHTAQVAKKSGLGRGVGAAFTLGVNLVGSNMRGDHYLTIVTDQATHVLHEDPPTEAGMKSAIRLAATGQSVMRSADALRDASPAGQANPLSATQETSPSSASSGEDIAEKLRELKKLHDEGLVSDDEFEHLRAKLVEQL